MEPRNNYRLCYINEPWAYFTSDFENQLGDDWNDAPYEHNAGEPYFPNERSTTKDYPDVFCVAFLTYLVPLCEGAINSRYSVDDINKALVPWLDTPGYMKEPLIRIWGGDTYARFIEVIQQVKGEVYERIKLDGII